MVCSFIKICEEIRGAESYLAVNWGLADSAIEIVQHPDFEKMLFLVSEVNFYRS